MKIVVTGPESSGKTSIAYALSENSRYKTIPEYAGTYLNLHGPSYSYDDLIKIAQVQQEAIKNEGDDFDWIIVTAIVDIKIWSLFKYNRYEAIMDQWIDDLNIDPYLFLNPDLPWTKDPLRENPFNRIKLFQLFEFESSNFGLSYSIIAGDS